MMKYVLIFLIIVIVAVFNVFANVDFYISQPSDGVVYDQGQVVTFEVNLVNPESYDQIIILLSTGFAVEIPANSLSANYKLPSNATGNIRAKAIATGPTTGEFIETSEIEISIRTPELNDGIVFSPKLRELLYVGEALFFDVYENTESKFPTNLTNEPNMSYELNGSSLEFIRPGVVVAKTSGMTTVSASIGNAEAQMEVSVFNTIKGDFDGDSEISQRDVLILAAETGREIYVANDARDINQDGVISLEDAIELSESCTIECEGIIVERVHGDLNNDQCVDRSDYSILMTDLRNGPPNNIDYDLNDDGQVTRADVRTLIGLFTNPRGAVCE